MVSTGTPLLDWITTNVQLPVDDITNSHCCQYKSCHSFYNNYCRLLMLLSLVVPPKAFYNVCLGTYH